MIAVMAYLGIADPAAAMRTYFENYYDRYRLVIGHPIAVAIVKLVEQPFLQFVRESDVRTFIYCALIMLGFSLAINGFALSNIRNLKLSDAM